MFLISLKNNFFLFQKKSILLKNREEGIKRILAKFPRIIESLILIHIIYNLHLFSRQAEIKDPHIFL